jgi:hypothetical protein
MAQSDIYIVPQDQTVNSSIVVVTDEQKSASGYQFDAVRRYRTKRTYRATRHSVPSGASITDHVAKDPISFQLVGVLTPYNVVVPVAVDISDPFAAAIFEDTAIELARKNRDQLVEYADKFTLLTVMGDEFQHANMIITSIDDPKTTAMGDSYELTVSFRQIRIPKNAARIAPIIDEDAELLGGGDFKDVSR